MKRLHAVIEVDGKDRETRVTIFADILSARQFMVTLAKRHNVSDVTEDDILDGYCSSGFQRSDWDDDGDYYCVDLVEGDYHEREVHFFPQTLAGGCDCAECGKPIEAGAQAVSMSTYKDVNGEMWVHPDCAR